jgi:hypothetical protein
MAIKNIIAQGIGFDSAGDSTTIFIPTLGFGDLGDGGTQLYARATYGVEHDDQWSISYQG